MNPKLLARYIFRELMGVVFMGVALFWAAGTTRWAAGWAALAVTLYWVLATLWVILRLNPGLLAERLGPRKGAKGWDTALLSLVGLVQLAQYALAGLDRRFGWSTAFAPGVQVAGLLAALLGYSLLVWATASNAYFSQIVRIQQERGHQVARGGPYRFVRHPGYAGSVLFGLGLGLLLGSWWGLLAGGVFALLMIVRTVLEDRTLQAELDGYAAYTREVRYRLLPGVW